MEDGNLNNFILNLFWIMSKKFEYNFTNENELIELRQRIDELEEENTLLKQSLQELIKVNTELTESIEQFNNQNAQSEYQNHQIRSMAETIQALNGELESMRKQLESAHYDKSKTSKKIEQVDERQTESLVNVLEELIESFKNMQSRYDGEIQEFNTNFQDYKNNYQFTLKKLEEEYKQKLNTLQPVMMQLQRKDQNLNIIEQRLRQLQKGILNKKHANNQQESQSGGKMGEEIKKLKYALEEKNRVIKAYQNMIQKLKIKFNQKL